MNASKLNFKPRFTPIPPEVDIHAIVGETPNFRWAPREDSRLHSAPFHKLSQIVHSVTVDQGIPIVVDNWHLRHDWNPSLFSQEWLTRTHGKEEISVRDLLKSQDIRMSMSSYLKQIPSLAEHSSAVERDSKAKPSRRHYAKDMDCPVEWQEALAQILPPEFSYLGAHDLMTKLPHEARAQNMLVYLGHGGTYTPTHKDMCATYAQNIMVATSNSPQGAEGVAYWFAFSARDRHRLADYWSTLGHEVDTEDFFASIEDLKTFPGNVWIIEQRLGDFVISPPLSAHQVYNRGGMTAKAAWSRITVDTLELCLYETLPSYRLVCRDEQYKTKATIHQSLLELSRFPPQALISSPFRRDSFMRLFRLYTSILVDEFIPPEDYSGIHMEKIAQEFNVTCSFCRTNIWNRFLTCKACIQLDADGDFDAYDICLDCYARGRSCRDITGMEWVQQEKWSDLMNLWERCRGMYQFLGGDDIDDFNTQTSISLGRKTLAGVCAEELLRRPNPHITQNLKNGLCHTCKVPHPAWKMAYCVNEGCKKAYCFGNLYRQFDEDPFMDVLSKLNGYVCPVCRGICNCGACRKKSDQIPYEPKLKSVSLNPKLVADVRSVESLVGTSRTNTRWMMDNKVILSTKSSSREPESKSERDTPTIARSSPLLEFNSVPNIQPNFNSENSNLDPSLIDPEMANYFYPTQPPLYTEEDTDPDSFEDDMLNPDLDPSLAALQFTGPSDQFESHLDNLTATPYISPFETQPLEIFPLAPSMLRKPSSSSASISPAMLEKAPVFPVAKEERVKEEVVWYSGGQKHIGGTTPPLTVRGGGKGKIRDVSKKETIKLESSTPEPPNTDSLKPNPPKPQIPAPEIYSPSPVSLPVKKGMKHQVNVETGLDTVKRIKLVFHGNPFEKKRSRSTAASDIKARSPREVERITPPAAIYEGRRLPTAKELGIDINSPPPEDRSSGSDVIFIEDKLVKREQVTKVEVVIPRRKINKSLYPMFLSRDARQTQIRRKSDGSIKGMIFSWE